jgi:sec-independent protein translocase protein TatA
MGLSVWHLIILLVIVLVVFGPGRLPSLGRGLGEAIRGFKQGLDGSGDGPEAEQAKRDQLAQKPQSGEAQRDVTHSSSSKGDHRG